MTVPSPRYTYYYENVSDVINCLHQFVISEELYLPRFKTTNQINNSK